MLLHQQGHDGDFLNYIHNMKRLYVTDGYEEYVLIYFEMLGMCNKIYNLDMIYYND